MHLIMPENWCFDTLWKKHIKNTYHTYGNVCCSKSSVQHSRQSHFVQRHAVYKTMTTISVKWKIENSTGSVMSF